MREILFRGKQKSNGEWVFGHYMVIDPVDKPEKYRKPMHLIVPVETNFSTWNRYLHNYYPIVPETLGQFTGLFDINGEKVFEGDILERKNLYCGSYERIVIGFDDASFGYTDIGWNKNVYYPIGDNECGIDLENYDLIGNIYDNPELLKKEK